MKDTPHIIVLDPAVKSAELIAFNNLVSLSPLPLTYHLPCLQGFRSVEDEDPKLIKGIVILGSLASVNDRQPWQEKLEGWVLKLMENKVPTFGICYGHQMISHLFGGTVGFLNSDKSKEVGLRAVTLEPNVLWGSKTVTGNLYTSHEEVVKKLPKEMTIIARSEKVEIDGIAHKKLPIWGLQSHPEATKDFLHRRGIQHENPDFSFGYKLIKQFFDYAKKKQMMQWIQNEGHVEQVSLNEIAEKVGTPCYVYSAREITDHCNDLRNAFATYPVLPCYAVKANSNLSILKLIFSKGFGADVVSQGELERALVAGVDPKKIVFSGVGKASAEIRRAVDVGIYSINIESVGEISSVQEASNALGKTTPIAIRINPNINVKTNPYIATGLYSTKFGIAEADLEGILNLIRQSPNVKLTGLSCHLGSQIMETGPFEEACNRVLLLTEQLRAQGFEMDHLDLGGGLGIQYESEKPPSFKQYASTLIKRLQGSNLKLLIEPGRSIVGTAGTLLTRVMNIKQSPSKTFVIVDAAMTELIRPSLYEAYHPILAVSKRNGTEFTADVVGPVCETGDILGTERKFQALRSGDLLGIECSGAYGSSMASNYNTRPKAPEVLVDDKSFRIIRKRESYQDLWNLES